MSKDYEAKNGDVAVAGEYSYDYKAYQSGWSVNVKDKTKTSYSEILPKIGGKPVTNMNFFRFRKRILNLTLKLSRKKLLIATNQLT